MAQRSWRPTTVRLTRRRVVRRLPRRNSHLAALAEVVAVDLQRHGLGGAHPDQRPTASWRSTLRPLRVAARRAGSSAQHVGRSCRRQGCAARTARGRAPNDRTGVGAHGPRSEVGPGVGVADERQPDVGDRRRTRDLDGHRRGSRRCRRYCRSAGRARTAAGWPPGPRHRARSTAATTSASQPIPALNVNHRSSRRPSADRGRPAGPAPERRPASGRSPPRGRAACPARGRTRWPSRRARRRRRGPSSGDPRRAAVRAARAEHAVDDLVDRAVAAVRDHAARRRHARPARSPRRRGRGSWVSRTSSLSSLASACARTSRPAAVVVVAWGFTTSSARTPAA